MRRISLVMMMSVLMMMLSLSSMITAQENPSGTGLQVVESDPLEGAELELDAPIIVYFDRALDCATVSDAVSITPEVAGETTCGESDTSLIFTPSAAYERGMTYTLTIAESLRGADGTALAEAYRLQVDTVGFLRVTEVLPAPDSTNIATDAVITVIFNRPVVPLGSVEDMENLPNPLTITPSIEGQGEWLNTAIYTFRPDTNWAGGTDYIVTVDGGLQAIDGATMQEAFSWSFTTTPPALVEVNPADASSAVQLTPLIQATFNQPINQISLEENFFVRANSGSAPAVTGTFEWNDDSTGFAFTPDEPLALGVGYDIGFPENAVFESTGNIAVPAETWSIVTVPYPAITGTSPFDGQMNAPSYGGLTLYFASAMDVDTLVDKITIEPEPYLEPDYYYQDYDNSLYVAFPTEPSTEYTIIIAPGMADIYGNTIDTALTFSYTTEPYSPDISLRVPGTVGFYNARNPETQVFVTHRNVSRLDLALYGVDLAQFIGLVTAEDTSYYPAEDYVPNSDNFLRSWQVPNVAPLNAMRYELLDMGSGTTVDLDGEQADSSDTSNPESTAPAPSAVNPTCLGAPASRVSLGDSVVVITEPDPLRARATPPDGEVLDLLYRDYVMPIVGGPTCVNGTVWWEVQLRDERRAWVAEGDTTEYYIDVQIAGGSSAVVLPNVSATEGPLTPGIYYMQVSSPETAQLGYEAQRHFMVVATANLTVKASINSITVWATDVQTGAVIPNAPIAIYDPSNTVIAQGVTDADGLLKVDIPRLSDLYIPIVAVLQTDDQFGVGITTWSQGIDPWQFQQSDNFYPRQYALYMYTDRPIYRPGQPVYYRGVLRSKDDTTYTPPDRETVPVKITDDQGEVIFEGDAPLTPYGTFSGQFNLADDAGLGYYYINVELPTSGRYQSEGGGISFGVAEYRLPEFQVEVTPDVTEVVQGDTISLTLDSRYFFGGAVTDANVEYNVISQSYYFSADTPGGRYDFIDFDYDSGPSEYYGGGSSGVIASGSGTTDEQGRLVIEVPADLEDDTQSQTFTIEAVVTDESEQAVAGRAEVIVHKGLIYIGARPADYVGIAGQETSFNFIAVDWEGNPIANQDIEVQIVERRWSSVQEQDSDGRTTWTYEVEEIPVTDGSVTTRDDGTADFVFTPPNGGIFKAIITSMDEVGNEVRSSTTIWVSSEEYVSWRQQNSNRIDLIADKDSYNIGDVGQILITSPYQGTTEALITIERGDVLTTEHVTMESNSYVYEFPISEDYAPNIYVSVLLIKGVDENNPVASFRMGLIQLGVDASRKEMTIEITPNVETAAPGETVTYTVMTTDYEGDPVQAEVGVGLTDLASLSIASPNSGEIAPFFYGQQGLSVRTGMALTINTDQLTQTVLDTIKGGGGGGGEGGIFDIREDFVDTAYWNAAVVTGEDGTATFDVILPDNLTTWRLDARAVTSGEDGLTLVGQDTFDLLSTRPLLIRPVTPRFFIVGDQVVLAAIVNNNTEAAQTVEVRVEGTGLTFTGDQAQTFEIAAGGRQRVEWPVTVDNVQSVGLTFFAQNEDATFTDASKPPLGQGDDRILPVYRYEAPEITGTGGVLREAGERTESIVLPQRFEVTQGELRVNVDTSVVEPVYQGLEVLRRYGYEYNNIEATVSRFLPNLMTYRVLQNNPDDVRPGMSDALDQELNLALQLLYAQQKADGGWGWYVQDISNPVVTAYALIGLAEAQAAGFAVDPGVISRAQQFLGTQFIVPGLNVADWQLNRQAFILYALARSGAADVARTATLFDFRDRLSLYTKALLAQTFDLIGGDDRSRIDTLLSDLVNDAILSANGAHWEEPKRDPYNWNTNTRTTAIVLDTLIKLNPQSDLIPNVVRWLMVARTADAWETSQETAWALMALADWLTVSDELNADYDFSVSVNGESQGSGNAADTDAILTEIPVTDLLSDVANQLIIERGAGSGTLYYDAYLRVYLPVPEIEPENRGIIVERRYSLLSDPTGRLITEAQVGDLVQVHLTIIAPNDLHYVVIEDPIPAGSDAVNPNLTTSQQIGTQPGLVQNDPLSQGWGWWWFSNIEFRDEKVVLNATYLPAGTYEYVYTIRPGLAGVYNVIPATGVEFYFPEVYGRSAGSTFTITPGE